VLSLIQQPTDTRACETRIYLRNIIILYTLKYNNIVFRTRKFRVTVDGMMDRSEINSRKHYNIIKYDTNR
jgi:hypothetical protein